MRRLTSHTTHLVAALAVTAAAVLTAFAMPLPAHAVTINLFSGNGSTISGSGKEVAVARPVGAFSVLRLDGSTIHPAILVPLIVMLVAFTLLFLTLHLAAMRNEILRRRVRTMMMMRADARAGF